MYRHSEVMYIVATLLHGVELWAILVVQVLRDYQCWQWREHITTEQLVSQFSMLGGVALLLVQCRL